jgi:hypothetical protein
VISHAPTHWRTRWFTPFFVMALVLSIAFGGIATRADDPATATPNNTAGELGAPPATPVPTATTAPTATISPTATASLTATVAPTTATPTPDSAASPASTTSGTPAAAPAATGTDTPTTGAPPADTTDDNADYQEIPNGGGSNNIVKVQNKTDNRLRVKAKIQLNHIPGDNVQPVNYAQAIGSCTNCQTFAVALQIDLRSRTATTVAPQNAAVALNVKCTGCTTVADAYQYVVPVDDPTQVPDNVRDLINQMQQQLNASAHDKDETAADAEAKINAIIAQFNDLGQSLYQQHDQTTDNDTPGATVPPDATVLTPTPTTVPQDTPTATP